MVSRVRRALEEKSELVYSNGTQVYKIGDAVIIIIEEVKHTMKASNLRRFPLPQNPCRVILTPHTKKREIFAVYENGQWARSKKEGRKKIKQLTGINPAKGARIITNNHLSLIPEDERDLTRKYFSTEVD